MLCSFEWHFRKRSLPIDRIARRLASVWDAILKVRMSAKASNDRIHWPRTRKRRATRKHGSVKWGKLAPITDRKRQRNSSSGAESLDSKGVTRLAALAISTRWFFNLPFSISFLVLFFSNFPFRFDTIRLKRCGSAGWLTKVMRETSFRLHAGRPGTVSSH